MKKRMNHSLIICASIVIMSSCSGGDSDLAKSGLSGNISSVVEHTYEAVHKDDGWHHG